MSRTVTSPRANSSPPTMSVTRACSAIGALHLRPHAARFEFHLRRQARPPQLAQQLQRLRRGRRRRSRRRTPAARRLATRRPRAARAPAARDRRRSRCPADRGRRDPSPARRTARRRAARSARPAAAAENLERRPRVVVEAAHEPVRNRPRNARTCRGAPGRRRSAPRTPRTGSRSSAAAGR